MSNAGRPSLYKESYIDELITFFSVEPFEKVTLKDGPDKEKIVLIPNKHPTLARFALNIGVCRDTLYHWATQKDDNGNLVHPEFSYAYKKAKDYQEALLVEGGLAGAYNSTFAIFTAKNVLDWKDKQEVTGANGGPIETKEHSTLDIARRIVYLLSAGIEEQQDQVDAKTE